MPPTVNYDALGEVFGESFVNGLSNLAEGVSEDLQKFGFGIARNMTQVMQLPESFSKKQALMAELRAQARALAEQNRIRLNNESWKVFDRIYTSVETIALGLISRAILVV